MALARASRFKGLLPALDRRQVEGAFVADGKNFLIDAEGPYSAFGNQVASYDRISDAKVAKTIADPCFCSRVLHLNKGAIYEHNEASDIFEPVFTFTDTGENFPWSHASVGGKLYFARHGVTGIIEYNPTTNSWNLQTADVPSDIYAVCRANGRLVVLSATAVTWSEIANGLNLTTDVELGIGSQLLAEHAGGGVPLGLLEVADGFITVTTQGLMKSEYTAAQNPFRHYQLSGLKHAPLSAFCIVDIADEHHDSEHVILTKTGLYIIESGQTPKEWQSLMSQYLVRKLFPLINATTNGVIRLSYSVDRQWLFISIAETEQPFQYSMAFVIYVPINEFGSFDHPHITFGELSLSSNLLRTFNFGYVDINGDARQFTDLNTHETTIDCVRYEFYRRPYEFQMERNDGDYIAKTVIRCRTHDQSGFNTETAFYDLDTDEVLPRSFEDLDAYVTVGMFRATDEDHPERFTNAWVVSVGMEEQVEGQIFEDWMDQLLTLNEDWNSVTTEVYEDWGSQTNPQVDYDLQLFGSLDGYNVHAGQLLTPQEIEQDDLDLDLNSRVKFFDAEGLTGIYILSTFLAQSENKSFHLKLLEMKLTIGGVM